MDYNAFRDIQLRKRFADTKKQRQSSTYPATVASVDGSTYHPVLGEDYAWVLLFNTSEGFHLVYDPQRLNLVGSGTPVIVMRAPDSSNRFKWQIVGINDSVFAVGDEINVTVFNIGKHAETHQYIAVGNSGDDPVFVFPPMLMPLKTQANGSTLNLSVYGYEYEHEGSHKSFPGQSIFMTTYMPATGFTKQVLLYLDRTTNMLDIVEGSSVVTGNDVPEPVLPTGSNGEISSRITLVGDQTAILQSDVEDARDWLGNSGSFGNATTEGQILIADTDLNTTWADPLVDEDGNIMTDENSRIMWV